MPSSTSTPRSSLSAAELKGPAALFTLDHRHCDALWAAVEAAANGRDAGATRAAFEAFDRATRRHLDMEEDVLFPAFEDETGMTMGPTRMMCMEHQQMRGVLARMATASAAGDFGALLDHGDTLWMLTQQHNVKEEGILYPMCEARLGARWPDLLARLDGYLRP